MIAIDRPYQELGLADGTVLWLGVTELRTDERLGYRFGWAAGDAPPQLFNLEHAMRRAGTRQRDVMRLSQEFAALANTMVATETGMTADLLREGLAAFLAEIREAASHS